MRRLAAVTTLAAVPIVLAAPTAHADGQDAMVSVLHGVPGLTVDVYANGKELLPNFEPGTVTDPLSLPAGQYDLAVYEDGQGPDNGEPAIEANDVEVPAGANVTVAAHLDAEGTPKLTPFVNDTSEVSAGKARLTVRHTAAAPAVDVRAGGTPVVTGLTNPNGETLEVDAGTINADVTLAGTDTVAIGPAELPLKEGSNTVVYAWGSAENENLELAVQDLGDAGSAPGQVPAGGLESGVPGGYLAVGGVALAVAGLAGRRAFLSRRR